MDATDLERNAAVCAVLNEDTRRILRREPRKPVRLDARGFALVSQDERFQVDSQTIYGIRVEGPR